MEKRKRTFFLILALLFLLVLVYYFSSFFYEREAEKPPVDAEGYVYETVKIGDQVWFSENLKTAQYQDGESWCYDDENDNCEIYGRLYNWDAAMVSCPDGWSLPSDEDWQKLQEYVGGDDVAGVNLKSVGFWESEDEEAREGLDRYGFSVLPSGQYVEGYFYDLGLSSFFWTSSGVQDIRSIWSRTFSFNKDEVIRSSFSPEHAFSVRCIKEETSLQGSESEVAIEEGPTDEVIQEFTDEEDLTDEVIQESTSEEEPTEEEVIEEPTD